MSWSVVWQSTVGLVVIAAGAGKATTPGAVRPFLVALGLPPAGVSLAGYGLPIAEIVCGVLVLVGVRPWPALAALALSAVFVGVLSVARRAGVSVGCRCFGALDSTTLTPVAVARAAALLVLAAVLVVAQRVESALPPWSDQPASVLAGAAAAFVFVVAFALLGKVYEFETRREEATQ